MAADALRLPAVPARAEGVAFERLLEAKAQVVLLDHDAHQAELDARRKRRAATQATERYARLIEEFQGQLTFDLEQEA